MNKAQAYLEAHRRVSLAVVELGGNDHSANARLIARAAGLQLGEHVGKVTAAESLRALAVELEANDR
jgi:hypothetical protein